MLPVALESYILTLPEGEDPDTFLLNNVKENFDEFLNQKVPALDYLVQQTIKKYPDSIQGRMQALDELLPPLYEIQDPKRRQLTLMTIGERMNIPPELLSKELKRKRNKNLYKIKKNDSIVCSSENNLGSQDEQWLLQSLLRKGKLWPHVREHIKPEEFQTPNLRWLYEKLLQLPDAVLQAFDPFTLEKSDPDLFQSLMLLLSEAIPSHDFGLSLLRMKERNLEIEYQEWLLHSKSNEERAKAALKRRLEEKNLKEIKQIIDNILSQ